MTGAEKPSPSPSPSPSASDGGFWAAVRRSQAKPWMAENLSTDPVMRLPWLGFRIFKWLIIFSFLIVVILVMYAYKTYPSADAILKSNEFAPGTTFSQKLEVLAAERATWVSNIKDLGQLFLVAPIFSLIGTVIGYIFGVSRQTSEPSVRLQNRGGADRGRAGDSDEQEK